MLPHSNTTRTHGKLRQINLRFSGNKSSFDRYALNPQLKKSGKISSQCFNFLKFFLRRAENYAFMHVNQTSISS